MKSTSSELSIFLGRLFICENASTFVISIDYLYVGASLFLL